MEKSDNSTVMIEEREGKIKECVILVLAKNSHKIKRNRKNKNEIVIFVVNFLF